jgi:hypothetical protein
MEIVISMKLEFPYCKKKTKKKIGDEKKSVASLL